MNKKYLEYAVVIVIALALAYFFLPGKPQTFGSATGYDSLKLTPSATTGDSYAMQVNGTTTFDMAGNEVANINSSNANFLSLTVGSAGTAITNYSCATATWNPGSIATSTTNNATTTDVPLAGAALGDICNGSLTSATTSAIAIDCNITGTATGTLQITNLGTTGAAIDLATGTAKVCFTH